MKFGKYSSYRESQEPRYRSTGVYIGGHGAATRYAYVGNTDAMNAHNATLDACRAVDLRTRAQRAAKRKAMQGRKPRTARELRRLVGGITRCGTLTRA